MELTVSDLFIDPAFRAPIFGSVLIGIAAGLLGAIILLRRQSLLGETISHACFPGIILGSICSQIFSWDESTVESYLLLSSCAVFFAVLAQKLLLYLVEIKRVKEDSALLIVLTGFFGIGALLSSYLQFEYPGQYKLSLSYLYGQAATLTDMHLFLYGIFLFLTILLFVFFHHILEMKIFNREYFASLYGSYAVWFQNIVWALILIVIVFGIRSLGVVLMSALLITPALTARLLTQRFSSLLFFSALFGALSTLLGNCFSLYATLFFAEKGSYFSIPSGPSIILVAFAFCFLALLFSPKNGLIIRALRILHFRMQTVEENMLKMIWREQNKSLEVSLLANKLRISPLFLHFFLLKMENKRLVKKNKSILFLTEKGRVRAEQIVRLHRLWELYLVECVKIGKERVHMSAEQMEHVLTPELEYALTAVLNNPQEDPHKSPIPQLRKEGF